MKFRAPKDTRVSLVDGDGKTHEINFNKGVRDITNPVLIQALTAMARDPEHPVAVAETADADTPEPKPAVDNASDKEKES